MATVAPRPLLVELFVEELPPKALPRLAAAFAEAIAAGLRAESLLAAGSAFTPYATCPLPTAQNRLKTRVTAGEKKYRGGHE